MSKKLYFGIEVLPLVLEEIQKAKLYIRVAIFQLHNEKLLTLLKEKVEAGLRVEVFTLPYDSINDTERQKTEKYLKELETAGGIIYFCKWNVGDRERTSTAVGRWYSFHGKFLITEQAAIGLSANLMQKAEVDAMIIYSQDEKKIIEFNSVFDYLVETFVSDEGNKLRKIVQAEISDKSIGNQIFSLPKVIETKTHSNFWIKEYPITLCVPKTPLGDGLYVSPFNGRARSIFENAIQEAGDFVYISTESFTDSEFARFLIKNCLRGVKIKILTGVTSMDFTDRMGSMFRDMLANGIEIKTTLHPLHAKMLLTDQKVLVSSVNLNKMNLGFPKTAGFWRSNTETITIESEEEVIKEAKEKFGHIFKESIDVLSKIEKKRKPEVADVIQKTFAIRSTLEAKELLAKVLVGQEIEVKRTIYKIGKLAKGLLSSLGGKTLTKEVVLQSLILYFLSERKLEFSELEEKIKKLDPGIEVLKLLTDLQERNYIEKSGDFYKIDPTTLLK